MFFDIYSHLKISDRVYENFESIAQKYIFKPVFMN